jgi:hypothetical protein
MEKRTKRSRLVSFREFQSLEESGLSSEEGSEKQNAQVA